MRLTGLGDINTVAATIQQVEGYLPPNSPSCNPPCPNGSLAYQNNNPGNLRYAGQAGAVPGAGGFAAFPSYDAGYQALLNQINLNASSGMTIAQFTAQYAPASDGNDPAGYAAMIANAAGVSVNDPLSAAIDPSTGLPLDTSSVGGMDDTTLTLLAVGAALALAYLLG
jgi:hypothetical protein